MQSVCSMNAPNAHFCCSFLKFDFFPRAHFGFIYKYGTHAHTHTHTLVLRRRSQNKRIEDREKNECVCWIRY